MNGAYYIGLGDESQQQPSWLNLFGTYAALLIFTPCMSVVKSCVSLRPSVRRDSYHVRRQ